MNFKRSLTNIKTAMGRGKLLHYLFLSFLFLSIGISGIAQTACWSESINNKVRKITLGVLPADATSATTVASALVPNHLFLDGRNASFYWAVNGSGKIQRATVTGAALTDVVTGITGVGVYVQGIYLDVTNNLLYWCETATGAADKIRVINISGVLPKLASAGTDVVTGIGNVRGITKDTIANTIYFADGGLTGQGKGIYRASLAVLPVTAVAATKIALTPIALPVKPQPNTLILDRLNNFIYWSDYANPGGGIFRAATNAGTYPVTPVNIFSGQSVRGISIDFAQNTIYWLEPITLKIRRAPLTTIPIVTPVDVVINLSQFPRDLVFAGPNTVLPVTFIHARAYQKGAGLEVEWKLGMELDMDKYIVEKSANGSSFNPAGMINSMGNTNLAVTYRWFDALPFSGDNYYRIAAISKNGQVQHSNIIRINMGKGNEGIAIYPNPVEKDNSFGLEFHNLKAGKYTISIFNKLGQIMVKQSIDHTGGNRVETISISNFATGTYTLKVDGKENRFIKNLLIN